ncbi:hypothetical protein ARMSODRAFT_973297 [Armillaria solidipes]|uniref:Uncharacterized protein n=1 Tax=Armillaria solidipes TaxID=1076256 RepID=A0A2H3C8S8_9AGAR|nr:hypothetical protein ARMSODRAFT_973297 [Armillaria solidipes]
MTQTNLTSRTPSPQSQELETPRPRPCILLPSPTEWQPTPSTLMVLNTSGTSSPPSTGKSLGPTTPWPGSYKDMMSKLTSIPEAMTECQWDGTSQWTEEIQFPNGDKMQQSWREYSPIETERYMVLHLDSYYEGHTWMGPPNFNQFDTFNYDYGSFRELDEVAPWTQRMDRNVSYPFRLPDSLPPQKHSRPYAGQGDGSAGGSKPAPAKTIEELRAAREEVELKLRKIEELQKELNNAEMAH